MVLCEHRAWFRAAQAWPRRARVDRAAARTRGYCWSKVTEWSGARGGFILARRVPCGSAQVLMGPVTLLERQGDSERFPRLFSLFPGLLGGVHRELSPTGPTAAASGLLPPGLALAVALSTEGRRRKGKQSHGAGSRRTEGRREWLPEPWQPRRPPRLGLR